MLGNRLLDFSPVSNFVHRRTLVGLVQILCFCRATDIFELVSISHNCCFRILPFILIVISIGSELFNFLFLSFLFFLV